MKTAGKLEIAQRISAYESLGMTGLDDRRDDDVSPDEVERIGIGDWELLSSNNFTGGAHL